MRDHSQLRTSSGKKTPKGCTVKGHLDNVVLIDVDSDGIDNVIIVDVPESFKQKLKGSSVSRERNKFPLQGIISIDDDETNNVDHPEIGVEGCGGDLDSDASSCKSCPASNFTWNSVDLDDDECQVIREKKSSFKLSKCKQKCFSKAPSRNRYGLGYESESGSSESDCSDCELMEGSIGKLREQWEKASLRRKYNVNSGVEDQTSASGSHTDANHNVEVENRTKKDAGAPVFSNSSNENIEKGNPSAFVATGNGDLGGTFFNPKMENPSVGSDQKLDSESLSQLRSGPSGRTQFSEWKASVQCRGKTFSEDAHGGASFCDEERSSQGPSLWFSKEQSNKQNHTRSCFMDKGQNIMGENSKSQPGIKMQFDHRKAGVWDEDASACKSEHSGETHVHHERVVFTNKDEEFSHVPRKESQCRSVFKEKEKQASGESLALGPQFSDETQDENGIASSFDKLRAVPEESFFVKSPSCSVSEINSEKVSNRHSDKLESDETSLPNIQRDEAKSEQGKSHLAEAEEPSSNPMAFNSRKYDDRDPLCTKGGDSTPSVEKDIINDREKLKETDEYKRAVEEEWASRQRQLQIQSEEAQRLRKRRKAESMRFLDMTRRQKQRLEEMRETQKKEAKISSNSVMQGPIDSNYKQKDHSKTDEENLNLKEQIRVEVRKELNKLEMACLNMASLLRGLGIPLGGGVYPLSHEVHTAYKQALLKFHPDRASRTDIRQQVEAEEKFKLISRMKEKFLSTS